MADMTDTLKQLKVAYKYETPIKWVAIDLDFDDADNASILTVATHNILDLAIGEAVVEGYGVVYTSLTSTSTDTIQFKVSTGTLTAALVSDNLVAGQVFKFNHNDLDGTVGQLAYAKSAATTLDMVVTDHALTGGRIILMVGIINVNDMLSASVAF